MKTTNKVHSKKAEDMLRKLTLVSKINYVTVLKKNPKKLFGAIEEIVVYFNQIDTDPHLEETLSQLQLQIIQKNWTGIEYPKKYLGGEYKEFWKAKTEEEKANCITILDYLKSWPSLGMEHRETNNFHFVFWDNPDVAHYSKYLEKRDFDSLNVPMNVLAKIYIWIRLHALFSSLYCSIHNAVVGRDLPEKSREEYYPLIKVIEEKVTYDSFVWENIISIFEKLTSEFGYNPIMLRG